MSAFVLLTPRKPAWGDPCNGCGMCCQSSACQIAQRVSGDIPGTPCSLLEWDGAKYRCGALRIADSLGATEGAFLRMKLGVGFGCDAEATTEDMLRRMQFEAQPTPSAMNSGTPEVPHA